MTREDLVDIIVAAVLGDIREANAQRIADAVLASLPPAQGVTDEEVLAEATDIIRRCVPILRVEEFYALEARAQKFLAKWEGK